MSTTTCGIFLFDKDMNLLIVHGTNLPKNNWSIPKGLPDAGETQIDAAIRELAEETGIILNTDVYEVGGIKYQKQNKYLHAFVAQVNKIDLNKVHCTSMVERGSYSFPEVDKYLLVNIYTAHTLLHESQEKLLDLAVSLITSSLT